MILFFVFKYLDEIWWDKIRLIKYINWDDSYIQIDDP